MAASMMRIGAILLCTVANVLSIMTSTMTITARMIGTAASMERTAGSTASIAAPSNDCIFLYEFHSWQFG
jgi:hypothetical protein